ncbi:MAG: aminotransferase class V-fold PLP-dependent enzyme [Crocinitomicaceae bacterium]
MGIKDQFLLRPDITFLNHGSFGACPKPVFEEYQNFQRLLEAEPIQFITKTGPEFLDTSKLALANYLNCDKNDLVYVTNPTTSLNIVISNLDLQPGDEILSTDHEYGALDRTWNFYCKKTGAKYVRQHIPIPLKSHDQFIEEFWKGYSPKTKVVFISHLTSSTSLIFPVKEICEKAKELGLITIVDGAHVPNHIPLDLSDIKADAYTGACHKWLLAPKGSTFLYVNKDLQRSMDPLIVSWGYEAEFPSDSQFQDYHQYQGTRDFSAFLTTPACLTFLQENNWEERKGLCRSQLQDYYPIVAKELDTNPICPLNDQYLGQICSIPIKVKNPIELKQLLYDKYKIEIPVFANPDGRRFLRISFQAYNGVEEIEILINALRDIKKRENLIE